MPSNNKRKLKLLYLVRLLQNETDSEQGLTMPQIIQRLSAEGIAAERKSLYRDFAALREAGYDLRALPTRPVQYALARTDLSFDDIMLLVDLAQSSKFLTNRKSSQLVKSLKGLTSERERKLIDRRVHVQGRLKNQSESIFHSVDTIHDAMHRKRKVNFLYFSYGTNLERAARHEGKLYAVTPIKVVFADNNYYLAAFDEGAGKVKTYRVDRMELLQVSDEPAADSSKFAGYDPDEFAYQSFGMFNGKPVYATLRAEAPMMDAVVDRFGRDVDVLKSTPEYADVRVRILKSPQFFGWIAGLNGAVTIKAPKKLREEYRDYLRALLG